MHGGCDAECRTFLCTVDDQYGCLNGDAFETVAGCPGQSCGRARAYFRVEQQQWRLAVPADHRFGRRRDRANAKVGEFGNLDDGFREVYVLGDPRLLRPFFRKLALDALGPGRSLYDFVH